MNKYLLIFILLFSASYVSMAQDVKHCGVEDYMTHLSVTNPSLYKQLLDFQQRLTTRQQAAANQRTAVTSGIITIPVVVHVIHNTASGTIGGLNNPNITDAQILSQIDVLNKDYQRMNADASSTSPLFLPVAANCGFSFCLANVDPNGNATTGITRTYNSQASYTIADDVPLKALAYWPSSQYLNIWVCNLKDMSSSQTLLGYTQPPGGGLEGLSADDGAAATDGVVINFNAFGTVGSLYTDFNLGRTATHEIGHWFGLLHPWGNYNSGDCSLSDYCDDTPTCGDPYESSSPSCPDTPPVSCSDVRMIQNYMEYSDDGCMNLFSNDQKTRMRSSLDLSPRRQQLFNSLGCCNIPSLSVAPYKKDFEDGDILSDNWTVSNANSNSAYTKGFELAHVSAYGEGSYAVSVANDSIYSSSTAASKYHYSYMSPYLNLQKTVYPVLHFDWAYSPQTAGGATDSIVVYLAVGCSDNWSVIQQFYGSSFTSTSRPRSAFTPQSAEWITANIDLSAYTRQPAVRIKFVAYSKGVNTFYLDNIDILNSAPYLLANIYPNPTTDVLNVESYFISKKNIQYTIYNSVGQCMYQSTDANVYSNTKQIDVSRYAGGMYFIQVTDGNEKVLKRFIKL